MQKLKHGGMTPMKRFVTAFLVSMVPTVVAPASSGATDVKFSKWVKEVSVGGDIRARQENFDNSGGTVDRQRQRLRVRVKTDFKLEDNLTVKSQFATTESGDQVSTNQTLTNNADKKPIEIDKAYIEWKALENLKLNFGKMSNPFWTVASSDLMWDPDYTPEGLSESWNAFLGGADVFINLGQFSIQERSGNLQDAYLFSEQVGAEFKLPLDSSLKTAVAHHEFANIKQGDIGGVGSYSAGGNSAGTPFSILEWTSALSFWLGRWPISLQGSYVQNMAAVKSTVGGALAQADEQDTGVHAGAVIGKAKKGAFEAAYFYKEIDQDAAVAGITDSDMPNTVNTKGHIGWVAYGINDFVTAQIKHFDVKKKVVAAGAADGNTKRTQFDVSVKF